MHKPKEKASTANKGNEKVGASSASNASKGKEKVDASSGSKGKPTVIEKKPKGFGVYISPNTGDSYVKVLIAYGGF